MINKRRFLCCGIVLTLLLAGCNSNKVIDNEPKIPEPQIVRYPPAADFTAFMNNGEKLQVLPVYDPESFKGWQVDLRSTDLTLLNLSDRKYDLLNSSFDSKTKWPESLPQGFSPEAILNINKNPGLDINKIHNEGITGKGINISIIDYALLVDHVEFSNRIKMYEEINCLDKKAQMHAPAVASVAAGKTVGVAPEANIYFIGSSNFNSTSGGLETDFTWTVKAVERIINVNKTLPKNHKIKVLSISGGCSPDIKGYNEFIDVVKKAEEQGIFVISANLFETSGNKFYYCGLDINTLSDRDNPSSYNVMPWDKWMSKVSSKGKFSEYYEKIFDESAPDEILLVPMETKTTASPTGTSDYVFYRQGGWSFIMPFLSGMYALACQVKPDITPEIFWSTALETGDIRTIKRNNKNYVGKIINPEELIKSLKNMK